MTRTPDLLITNQLLYRLSYTSKFIPPDYYNSMIIKKQDRKSKFMRSCTFKQSQAKLTNYQILQGAEFVIAILEYVKMFKHVSYSSRNAGFVIVSGDYLYSDIL